LVFFALRVATLSRYGLIMARNAKSSDRQSRVVLATRQYSNANICSARLQFKAEQ